MMRRGHWGLGRIDPHLHGARRRPREAGGEAFRVSRVGRGEYGGPHRRPLLGQAVVDVMGCQEAKPAVAVFAIVPAEEPVAVGSRVFNRAEPVREAGPILQGLKLRLREGVVETCGREWVLVTPRSASNRATGFEVIAGPRSAWTVSYSRPIPWRAHVSRMNRSARAALSRCATIQPTTYRLNTSSMTYREK